MLLAMAISLFLCPQNDQYLQRHISPDAEDTPDNEQMFSFRQALQQVLLHGDLFAGSCLCWFRAAVPGLCMLDKWLGQTGVDFQNQSSQHIFV